MPWIYITIFAYFIAAVVAVIEKFLLQKAIPNSVVFTFYTGILSIFILPLALFFDFYWPGIGNWLIYTGLGILFLVSLFAFFEAIARSEISRVVVVVGAMTSVFTFIFERFLFGRELSLNQIAAFVFLVVGGVMIMARKKDFSFRYFFKDFYLSFFAGALMGLYYSLVKEILRPEDFFNGFIWTRMGSFLASFIFLVPLFWRKQILGPRQKVKTGNKALFVINKGLGGFFFILINFSISLAGNASIVNSLTAVQYVFVFILTLGISVFFPKFIKEKISGLIVLQKVFSIILVGTGLFLLMV
ncbi:MAG: hypothetical protein UV67_C0008G0023 [Parcubacteria group bacterium GW2011_GWC1_43_12]|nr:MAG: hypothetical protein UV34_C0013G0017 [Parcubacteria group bacterium GW2011_GWB1_42_6]KKS92201.1 MAG: hypothetical protein UV67_C0008G0023 [Parcubacteria group bacterium GW2011_GWC1_43_12]